MSLRNLPFVAVVVATALAACGGKTTGGDGSDGTATWVGGTYVGDDDADASSDAAASRDGLAVGDGALGTTGDAAPGSSCPGDILLFSNVSKTCTQPSDCAVVFQQIDCCGSLEAIGIDASSVSAFDGDEPVWVSMCPACGCPPGATIDEDGVTAPSMASFAATCSMGHCVAHAP